MPARSREPRRRAANFVVLSHTAIVPAAEIRPKPTRRRLPMRVTDLACSLLVLVPACFAFALAQIAPGKSPAEPRETWVHKFAAVNGVKLHYVEQGKGPAILFLHGFPEFWYAWKDLLPEFAKDHRAIALDMPGYNLSESPAAVEAYRVPVIVEDVRALMAELGARKFVLVGQDRKSTRLNSSHGYISYAVFCLKKKMPSKPTARGRNLLSVSLDRFIRATETCLRQGMNRRQCLVKTFSPLRLVVTVTTKTITPAVRF